MKIFGININLLSIFNKQSRLKRSNWIITGSLAIVEKAIKNGFCGFPAYSTRFDFNPMFNKIKKGDILLFYCFKPVYGIIAYAIFTNMYSRSEQYWSEAYQVNETHYHPAIYFNQTKIVKNLMTDKINLDQKRICSSGIFEIISTGEDEALNTMMKIDGAAVDIKDVIWPQKQESNREICPRCKQKQGVPIRYGLFFPSYTYPYDPDEEDYVDGGCMVGYENTHCRNCGYRWRIMLNRVWK